MTDACALKQQFVAMLDAYADTLCVSPKSVITLAERRKAVIEAFDKAAPQPPAEFVPNEILKCIQDEIGVELMACRSAGLSLRLEKALQNLRPAPPHISGVKCTHCNGKGRNDPVYDEHAGGQSGETVCDTCGGSGKVTTIEQYLKTLPANWHEDSSLQTWFPITAEEVARLKAERSGLAADAELLKFYYEHSNLLIHPSFFKSLDDWRNNLAGAIEDFSSEANVGKQS